MAAKKGEQADRITIMMDEDVHQKLQLELAKAILGKAKGKEEPGSISYSRIINAVLEEAFEKGIDKKIIADFKK